MLHTFSAADPSVKSYLALFVLSGPLSMTPVCWLFTQTGFKAMFGLQFAKSCHHQDGICAEVIRQLSLFIWEPLAWRSMTWFILFI